MGAIQLVTDRLEKPELDDRSYRVIRLPNQLEALLVHDPDTDKAGAAMDVNVGNFGDPKDLQGLAHCLEHMLFMGTEKVSGHSMLEFWRGPGSTDGRRFLWVVSQGECVQSISRFPFGLVECIYRRHGDELFLRGRRHVRGQ